MATDTKPAWEIEQRLMELRRLRETAPRMALDDFASRWGEASIDAYERQLNDELRDAQAGITAPDAEID